MHAKPYAHQTVTLKRLMKEPRIFDTSDPGTGKTRPEVEHVREHRKKGGGPALIFAPKSLLWSAWGSDFKKFAPDMTVSLCYADKRQESFDKPADAYITNHDAATWLAKQGEHFWKRFKNGVLIVDESSAYKHHTSQRSKAMAKIAKRFELRRLMTGTPNANGITDIWHQMYLVDDGKRLGRSFFAFRSATCVPEQVGPSANMVRWRDKENAEALVSALIKDVVIRNKFEDCVDIPKNHQYPVEFRLSKKHMEKYRELEAWSVLQLEDATVTAVNGAVLYGKLLQCASGAVYNDAGKYSLLDTERYEMVIDLAEARAHSVVFFNWTHQRDLLMKLAEARGLAFTLIDGTVSDKQRREAVDYFQAGFYRIMFAHPQSAGHGLTLTRGTATIWSSPTSNLEHYLQGLKRVHRIGQTEKTETIMVVAPDTIEQQVHAALMEKDAKMTRLLDYLKKLK